MYLMVEHLYIVCIRKVWDNVITNMTSTCNPPDAGFVTFASRVFCTTRANKDMVKTNKQKHLTFGVSESVLYRQETKQVAGVFSHWLCDSEFAYKPLHI